MAAAAKTPIALVLVFLVCGFGTSLNAADVKDQEQIQAGDEYRFAYAIKSNNVSKKIARQSFVPLQDSLSRVEIGLYANYDGLWPPCAGSTEKFDVFILNSNLDTIASKTGVPVCGLPTKVGFNPNNPMTAVSVAASLTPGNKYWIEIYYAGNALCYDGPCTDASLIWVRSAGDAYPKGESWTVDTQANNSRDFIFRTYGPSNSPPDACTLIAPANGAANQAPDVTLDWSCTDPNGNGDIVDYYLQFDDNGDFSSPLKNGYLGGVATDWNPSAKGVNLAYATTYYWRVYAKDKQGATNPPGTRWSFTTVPDPNRCLDGSPKDNIGDPCVHDEDKDTSPDGADVCPFDPLKSQSAGQCGCGKADTDTDGDKTADCNDACAGDPNKVDPGQCGCGIPEGCDCVQGQTRPCGSRVGECREGTQSCANGRWADCAGAVNPAFESCDGKDNDCDGGVDEGCNCIDGATKACGPQNIGECKEGKQDCSGGQWGGCSGDVYPVAEVCDGKDNDCDGATDEGGVCNSDANCGTFGNACGAAQTCRAGQCAAKFDYGALNGKYVMMPMELFQPVAKELTDLGKSNQVFYTNGSEDDSAKVLGGGLRWFAESAAATFGYVMLEPWQYKVLVDNMILENALSGNELKLIIQNADGVDDIVYLATPESQLAVDEASDLIYKTDGWIRSGELDKIDKGLNGIFALYYAGTNSDGDPRRFVVLAPTYYLAYANPPMVVLGFVKVVKDVVGAAGEFAWGVVGIDPNQFTCDFNDPLFEGQSPFDVLTGAAECGLGAFNSVWNVLGGSIDLLTDPKQLADAFYGECGLLAGKAPGCIEALGQGLELFTHPFPMIEEIGVVQSGNRAIFSEKVTDYNIIDFPFKDIWIGASILAEDELGCNYDLPPQSVSFNRGESKNVVFDYTFPDNFYKEKMFRFVSKLWYNCVDCSEEKVDMYMSACAPLFDPDHGDPNMCNLVVKCTSDFLGYKQCNPDEDNYYYCHGDELDQLGVALSGLGADFSIQNAPPIINDIRCDAPAILGIPCPEMIEIETGDELKVTAFANDPDGSLLDLSTAGDIGFVRSCPEKDGYDQVCTFTHEALPDDVGEHWFKVNAYDGYDVISRQFQLNVKTAFKASDAQAPAPAADPPVSPSANDNSSPQVSDDEAVPAGGCSLIITRAYRAPGSYRASGARSSADGRH